MIKVKCRLEKQRKDNTRILFPLIIKKRTQKLIKADKMESGQLSAEREPAHSAASVTGTRNVFSGTWLFLLKNGFLFRSSPVNISERSFPERVRPEGN